MKEQQPFNQDKHAKLSHKIQTTVNALSEGQMWDEAYGILDATDRKDLGKKNAKVLVEFGDRAEAMLGLPETLDALYKEKIGVPIFVVDKETDDMSLVATAFKVPDEELPKPDEDLSRLVVLSNRRFAVIDLGDKAELFNYKKAFNSKNSPIILPAQLDILDDDGKLLDEYTGDFFNTLGQAGAVVKISDENADEVDALIPYIEKAIVGIAQDWDKRLENPTEEAA